MKFYLIIKTSFESGDWVMGAFMKLEDAQKEMEKIEKKERKDYPRTSNSYFVKEIYAK